MLRLSDQLSWIWSVARAAIIGAVVGLMAWFAATLVGGGDPLTQSILTSRYTIEALLLVFFIRLAIGPWS